jgi:hypothetical protein
MTKSSLKKLDQFRERVTKRLDIADRAGKKTAGQYAVEAMQRMPEKGITLEEYSHEALQNYERELINCAELNRDRLEGDFFIEVMRVNNPPLYNTFKFQFMALRDCPSPRFNQDVHLYHADTEFIEYIWTLPDVVACCELLDDKNVLGHPSAELRDMVVAFADGTLMRKCKEYNNEEADSTKLKKTRSIHVT